MENFYNDVINFTNAVACFFSSVFIFISSPTLDSASSSNIYYVFSWLAFFHNPNIFPSVFILGLDAFIIVRVSFGFVSFVRWISGLFQNAKVW